MGSQLNWVNWESKNYDDNNECIKYDLCFTSKKGSKLS